MLDLVKETLNQIARSIEIRAKADWLLAIAFWWDVCPSAALSDESSDPIGVKIHDQRATLLPISGRTTA